MASDKVGVADKRINMAGVVWIYVREANIKHYNHGMLDLWLFSQVVGLKRALRRVGQSNACKYWP
jgi:hypothetical protein